MNFEKDFDLSLINNFRDKAMGNGSKYDKFIINGENNWDKICSCADWIASAVKDLNKDWNISNSNGRMEIFHLIGTIDVLVEGIINMYRSVDESYPLENDNRIFKGNFAGHYQTDDKYFKTIRAYFGVHGVNGNETNISIDDKKVGVRFFSSWISVHVNSFSVQIYSNNDQAEKRYGGKLEVNINDIVKYAKVRYELLSKLETKVRQKQNH